MSENVLKYKEEKLIQLRFDRLILPTHEFCGLAVAESDFISRSR